MRRIDIPIQFFGTVSVLVPDRLCGTDAILLATKLVLSRIVATADNPDAPEDDACGDYAKECSEQSRNTAESDWDQGTISGIGGRWTSCQETRNHP